MAISPLHASLLPPFPLPDMEAYAQSVIKLAKGRTAEQLQRTNRHGQTYALLETAVEPHFVSSTSCAPRVVAVVDAPEAAFALKGHQHATSLQADGVHFLLSSSPLAFGAGLAVSEAIRARQGLVELPASTVFEGALEDVLTLHGQGIPAKNLLADVVRDAFLGASGVSSSRVVRVLADGTSVHHAGATAALELAVIAGSLAAQLRQRGGDIWPKARVRVAVDGQILHSISKVRALYQILGRMGALAGLEGVPFLEAYPSVTMLASCDVETNILRLTHAGLAGVLGGATHLFAIPATRACGVGDEEGERLALTSCHVLLREGDAHLVQDPLAGSGSLESLSSQLAAAGWELLSLIEKQGGLETPAGRDVVLTQLAQDRDQLKANPLRMVGVHVHAHTSSFAQPRWPRASHWSGPDVMAPLFLETLA